MTKAYGYLRVSGRDQVDGDGFPRQRAAILEYAKAHGLEIVLPFFEERAVSGSTEWDSRPAWVELCAALNGVKTIVVERLDRLARDYGIQEWIIRDLRKRGLVLISTAEPDLGSDDPTRVLFRQIMGSIAQYEKTMIVLKLRGARQRMKAATGRCEGRKPYGEQGTEAAALAVMLNRRAGGGATYAEIAADLNARQLPPRGGGAWSASTVGKIVKRHKDLFDKRLREIAENTTMTPAERRDAHSKKG